MAGIEADSFYVKDCRQVQNSTHAIQTLAGQISKLVSTLSNDQEFAHCQGLIDDAVNQAAETQQVLARIKEHQKQAQNPAEKNNRRMMYRKLSDNLSITARVLEDVVRRFQTEEARRPSFFVKPQFNDADAAGGEEPLIKTSLIDTEPNVLQACDSLESDLASDRCSALQRVDQDIQCLQKIYTDLATNVEESTATFDSLETHMACAAADIERGREQIQLTDSYAMFGRRVRHKTCLVGGGVVAALVAFSYIIG